eukprot:maker-scaffold298_size217389-snap-gene-1.18 protein:Tk12580 transcript:maker-scaffold298_size217389-snap-gene-1.18-mRNA-1 annotation:"krab-a domain-containing protein"
MGPEVVVLFAGLGSVLGCDLTQWTVQKSYFYDCIREETPEIALNDIPKSELCGKRMAVAACSEHLMPCSGTYFTRIRQILHNLHLDQFHLDCEGTLARTKRSPAWFSSAGNSGGSSHGSSHGQYESGYSSTGASGYGGTSTVATNSKTKYAFKAVDKAAEKARNYVDTKFNGQDSKRASLARKIIQKASDKAKKALDQKLNRRSAFRSSPSTLLLPGAVSSFSGNPLPVDRDYPNEFGRGGQNPLTWPFNSGETARAWLPGGTLPSAGDDYHSERVLDMGSSSRDPLSILMLNGRIADTRVHIIIDTTSPISTIDQATVQRLNLGNRAKAVDDDDRSNAGSDLGHTLPEIDVQIGQGSIRHRFVVAEDQPTEVVLGNDVLSGHEVTIDLHENTMSFGSRPIRVDFLTNEAMSKEFRQKLKHWSTQWDD